MRFKICQSMCSTGFTLQQSQIKIILVMSNTALYINHIYYGKIEVYLSLIEMLYFLTNGFNSFEDVRRSTNLF